MQLNRRKFLAASASASAAVAATAKTQAAESALNVEAKDTRISMNSEAR
jgi:secreted PhoX family phosphatase